MAFNTGTEIPRIVFKPWLQTTKEKPAIRYTHCLYFRRSVREEKNWEMEVMSPTQVVRQARVKMAARSTAPTSPNSCFTMRRSTTAPFSGMA